MPLSQLPACSTEGKARNCEPLAGWYHFPAHAATHKISIVLSGFRGGLQSRQCHPASDWVQGVHSHPSVWTNLSLPTLGLPSVTWTSQATS